MDAEKWVVDQLRSSRHGGLFEKVILTQRQVENPILPIELGLNERSWPHVLRDTRRRSADDQGREGTTMEKEAE